MKATLTFALLSALSLTTTSALTIVKSRQAPPPTYTVDVVLSDGTETTFISDANGQVFDSFDPSVAFLVHADINNPANNVQCVVADSQGNQVRAFGGPNQFVDSIDLVPADGKQVFSLVCSPA